MYSNHYTPGQAISHREKRTPETLDSRTKFRIMNTLKSLFTLIIAIACLQFGNANTIDTPVTTTNTMIVQTLANTTNTVDLRLVGNTSKKVMIHLKDEAGKVIYFEKINNQEDYFRRFSFEKLADGNYYFSIRETDADAVIRPFILKDGIVKMNENSETVVLRSATADASIQVAVAGNQSINFHCVNWTNETTTLRLVDHEGEVWYFAKVKAGESCAKRLILSELPVGAYEIQMESTNSSAKHTFMKRSTAIVLKKELPRA